MPASIVYEDSIVLAFLDIHPINAGHILVVPKRHVAQFTQLTIEEAGHLFVVSQKILKSIQTSNLPYEAANLILSDGPIAGQEVLHSHLHIIPRFSGDGQSVGFRHSGPDQYPRSRLEAIASEI